MIRNSSRTCPTDEQLAESLEPLCVAEEQLTRHLESCESCRATLTCMAGDATWWNAAKNTLQTLPPVSTTRIIESVCALSVGDHSHSGRGRGMDDPLQKHEVDQLRTLLAPACHPELLGRIGRYELEQLIGRGGMGLVFRGHDTELHRIVAVKTLAIHLIPIGAARERFIREARASASLIHPHIVPVHDVITDGSVPALVMQYVAGPTLEQWIAQQGAMPWQQTLLLAIQLADALSLAHQKGLVHRDVKPGNVLLEADASRALLTDFGLVRTLDDATLTRSGMLAGTPDYMSPEQARGDLVEQSSDLFSLGSMLYTMLTGHPPFRAADPMAVMNRICHEKHRPVCQVQPEVPFEVGKLVDKLLAKEPRRRYSSAAELTERLQQLARAKRHLTSENLQRKKVLRYLAGSLLGIYALFHSSAAIFQRWQLDRTDAAVPLQTELVQVETQSTQGLQPHDDVAMPPDVIDLRVLDQQLAQVHSQVEQLLESYAAPKMKAHLLNTQHFENTQHELENINSTLQRLESEVFRQP